MYKVVSYIETLGTDRFKRFLNTPFSYKMLFSLENNDQYIKIFDNWLVTSESDKIFTCPKNNVTLQFNVNQYIVLTNRDEYLLPMPSIINDFINDMLRFNIDLYWTDWIDEVFEPKDFLSQHMIKSYYQELLNNMEKGHELNVK